MNFFTTLHIVLSLASPFIFLHYFAYFFYNLSLWDVVQWWYQNYNEVSDASFYFIGLFFICLFIFLIFSGFINILFLSLFGKRQELVYLGHSKQSNAVYYQLNDIEKKSISSYDSEQQYNFSFNDLFRSQTFIKDPSSTNSVGTKSNRFHPLSLIAICLAVILFSMAGAAFFNVFIYPLYETNPTEINIPTNGAEIAFDHIISRYGFTRDWYFGSLFSLVFIWIGFMLATPKNKLSKPITSLPSQIHTGNTIKGIPTEIKVRYLKRRRSGDSDTYENIDSGERYITFKFKGYFSHMVYITTLIDLNIHKNQINNIHHNITNQYPMKLTVNADFTISLPSL